MKSNHLQLKPAPHRFRRILVKVGTAVLTRANGRLDYNIIADLLDQLAQVVKAGTEVILVSSGAVGAGREYFRFEGVKDPLIKKQMLSAVGQGRLFQVYADYFREQGMTPAQALLTQRDFKDDQGFENIKNTLEHLLTQGVLPIINENDVVSYAEHSFGDNDQLAAMTAILMEVELLVILSDIQGFFEADPHRFPEAKLIPQVKTITPAMWEGCAESFSQGGTGGMFSKLKAAELANSYGIETVLTYGKKGDALLQVLAQWGDLKTGTWFQAKAGAKLAGNRRWVKAAFGPKGVMTLDPGAVKALRGKDRKSLLAVGIVSCQGKFQPGDLVLLQDEAAIRIGVGLVGVDDQQMQAWTKQKPQNQVVIHADHLKLY